MKYGPSQFAFMIVKWHNLCQWWYTCKNTPETELWIKGNSNFGKNGINSKLEHRKVHNSILYREIWRPIWESLEDQCPAYSGELVCMQLIAVLSGPLFFSWSATNLTMSVFSSEYGHTLFTGLLHSQSWEKYWDLEKSH